MQLTDRDEGIVTSLYFTRLQSTQQIADRFFNCYGTAKRRMYELKNDKGVVMPRTPKKGLTVWTLTRRAFNREVEALKREGEPYREWPKPRAIPHLVDTNDIYVEIADAMDEELGEFPEWEWKNEAQAWTRYKQGGEKGRVHQPDAEISFGGNVYFLERQTHRARKTEEQIDEKLENYRRYIKRLRSLGHQGELEVLFACDVRRDMEYVETAAAKYGLAMTAGKPGQIASHLLQKAKALPPAQPAAETA